MKVQPDCGINWSFLQEGNNNCKPKKLNYEIEKY